MTQACVESTGWAQPMQVGKGNVNTAYTDTVIRGPEKVRLRLCNLGFRGVFFICISCYQIVFVM